MGRKLRVPELAGQRFKDLNPGLLAVDGDVLGIKRQIEEKYPELEVYYDEVDSHWVIVEHCKDGVDRLAIQPFQELDQRILDRLHRADQQALGHVDVIEEVDNYNAEVEKDRDYRFDQKIGEASERLRHAFKKDGLYHHMDIYGPRRNK